MNGDLFADLEPGQGCEALGLDAFILRRFALPSEQLLWQDLQLVLARAPMRHMVTPGGFRMSVAMSNAGSLGWVSDKTGYRYDEIDPVSGLPWPAIPTSFMALAAQAAHHAGFKAFQPDACLINRYAPESKLSLHQDKNELDFTQPIVSVSLGLSATFLFGGALRTDKPLRTILQHGDVVVWGGASRLNYHGILPIKPGRHPLVGECRINLTFRHAGR
ncbi:DNA oxidative demethylase AlkB [Methylobacillus gramineus]|uniref:DNA oxidative demethylase AlkB n=1 Tax=Methylobacillus gramineus TaxID=755169 RepID=UPI001CFFFF16|nr:DNA oxidative demethylase AlkB [Methylobacillus gramineus]MCB5184215.1 DNA oxidative demethylase AlkB [Methylobacillus gramineus]